MKKFLFLFLVFILVLFVGCASLPVYRSAELQSFIGEYIQKYGFPDAQIHGENYTDGWQYVELYWYVNDHWYKVVLMEAEGEWFLYYDAFKISRI